MPRKKPPVPDAPFDFDAFRRDLQSPDAATRARAVRGVCPCRLGWAVFEQCMALIGPLRKDSSPQVRAVALHVFEDAFQMENEGLPTTPQAITNEMVARRRAQRWNRDAEELAAVRRRPEDHRARRRRPA